MTEDALAHVHPARRALVHADEASRIEAIETDTYIGYRRAELILERMADLLRHPRSHRMPNLLLIGETNNGKSSILRQFVARQLRARSRREGALETAEYTETPILHVSAPPRADLYTFLTEFLEELKAPYNLGSRPAVLQRQLLRLLPTAQVRMILVDEIHEALSANPQQQRTLLSTMKLLANRVGFSIVAAGTFTAANAFKSDKQLENRFHRIDLPRWERDAEFARFLMSLESLLPLRAPSDLGSAVMAKAIHDRSEGYIGEAVTLVRAAAKSVIRSGGDRITLEHITNAEYVPPSLRQSRSVI